MGLCSQACNGHCRIITFVDIERFSFVFNFHQQKTAKQKAIQYSVLQLITINPSIQFIKPLSS